ncbi:MAG: TRAP transporter fused permease subunit [Aestuariivita sp.]|nr:TRAP transporter fused permease subunit [Aestuariivita sp.]
MGKQFVSFQPFWLVLAFLSVAFHVGLIFWGLAPNLVARPIHMALILPWVFVYAAQTQFQAISGILLTVIGMSASLWVAWNHEHLGDQYGSLSGLFQFLIAITLLGCVLEAARRAIGWPLPAVAVLALLYSFFGIHIPGEFGHSGVPISSFLGTMTIAEGGIWGKLTAVSVGIVSVFVIFGAVLNAGEAGQGFMNMAAMVAGHLKGGAAKVSIIASALFGSISGSASANVASTGAITLPAMIKLGYPRYLAGAVEAVASSGGQIMPPLMGAGAFVMVELTGISYTAIMSAAILPALLYFFVVWIGINAHAHHLDLPAVDATDRPDLRAVAITSIFFMIPFAIFLWCMFIVGFTPQYSVCLAIGVGVLLLLVDRNLNVHLPAAGARITSALLVAAQQVALIASIILCASIIVGVLSITGLGVKITSLILSGSGNMLWPALLLTALACLLLGMEVPTTAAYVICVSVAGPALIQLGLEPLQAHLFVFWYALLSTITPPVCGAVFIASGMVAENWLRVALTAMSLGIGLYLIPLGMIANPDLIRLDSTATGALVTFVQLAVGMGLISYALIAIKQLLVSTTMCTVGLSIIFLPRQLPFSIMDF